jgi:altronate dehydratase
MNSTVNALNVAFNCGSSQGQRVISKIPLAGHIEDTIAKESPVVHRLFPSVVELTGKVVLYLTEIQLYVNRHHFDQIIFDFTM